MPLNVWNVVTVEDGSSIDPITKLVVTFESNCSGPYLPLSAGSALNF